MPMPEARGVPLLICAEKYGGCGFVGRPDQFKWTDEEHISLACPECYKDHVFGLTEQNLPSLTQGLDPRAQHQLRVTLNASM